MPVGGPLELKEKALAYSALTDDWLAAAQNPLSARGTGGRARGGRRRDERAGSGTAGAARSLAAEAGDRLRAVSAPGEINPAIHTAIHTVDGSLTYLLDRHVQLSPTGAPEFTQSQLGAMGIFLSAREESTPDRSRATA